MEEKKKRHIAWYVKIAVLTFAFSMVFSSLSKVAFASSSVIVAIVVLIILLVVQFFTDIMAVAIMSCDEGQIDKKEKGARAAFFLVRNRDKVGTVLCDIVGDVCGILSGAAGAAISFMINVKNPSLQILYGSLVASAIASIIVTGKAIGKTYATKNAKSITLACGRFLAIFAKKQKKIDEKRR